MGLANEQYAMHGLSPQMTKMESERGYFRGSGQHKQLEIKLLASALRRLSLRKLLLNLK